MAGLFGYSGQEVVGGYQKLEELGHGAFGTVYKGWKNGNFYALKELDLNDDSRKEVRPLLALTQHYSHPNIVLFIEGFEVQAQNRLWLVMEFCPLGTMNNFLLNHGSSYNQTFMKQIAGAVAFLHGQGIVHRDLKPDNVLVSGTAQNPTAKVADFGLAKVCENAFDDIYSQYYLHTGVAFRWYAAPEVWDRHYTEKCDIYSIGAMFAAMLDRTTVTGVDGKPLLAVYIKEGWEKKPVADVQRENPSVNLAAHIMKGQPDSDFKQLVLRMMAYDYHHRPTASEVNSALMNDTSGCTWM